MTAENVQEQPPVNEVAEEVTNNIDVNPSKSIEEAKIENPAPAADPVDGEVKTSTDPIQQETVEEDQDEANAAPESDPVKSATETAVELVHEMAQELSKAPAAEPEQNHDTASEPPKAPAAEPDQQRDELNENLAYLENVRISGTDVQKDALAAIEQFCSVMKPRSMISADQANAAQRDFLDFMTVLLRKREYDDFRKGWATLLVYFAEYHGDRPTASDYSALSEYSTSRHIDNWKKHEQAAAFCNLISLLRGTRRVETRKADAKRFLLDKISNEVIGANGLSHLQRFYG